MQKSNPLNPHVELPGLPCGLVFSRRAHGRLTVPPRGTNLNPEALSPGDTCGSHVSSRKEVYRENASQPQAHLLPPNLCGCCDEDCEVCGDYYDEYGDYGEAQ